MDYERSYTHLSDKHNLQLICSYMHKYAKFGRNHGLVTSSEMLHSSVPLPPGSAG